MRTDPPDSGPELVQLTAFLDYQRETMLLKCDGLTREQLAQPLPPSPLTLAGLLNHLAKVEDTWFRVRFAGLPEADWRADAAGPAEPDWDFKNAASVAPEELRERYRTACAASREVVAQAPDLDRLSARPRRDGPHVDLRWILIHMIEETARHAGHADLLREAIDGTVGE
jgi:uncharacterized damage-inducible protein DinB